MKNGEIGFETAVHERDGLYRATLEAGVPYQVFVDPSSLPEGWMAPQTGAINSAQWLNQRSRGNPSRLRKVAVELLPGESQRLDLKVASPAGLQGRLLDPAGSPVAGSILRLTDHDSTGGIHSRDAITNQDGNYHFEQIYPGRYRLTIHADPRRTPGCETWSVPAPTDVTLQPGELRPMEDLQFGTGQNRVLGRILNQDGLPYPNLPILLYPAPSEENPNRHRGFQEALARCRTDAEGRFQMEDVESVVALLSLTSSFHPGTLHEPGHPAMWVPDVPVDLSGTPGSVDVGDLVVDESRPFLLKGSIAVDSALGESEFSFAELRLELVAEPGSKIPPEVRRIPWRNTKLDLASDGTFRCRLETPSPTLQLKVGWGEKKAVYRIHTSPNGDWKQVVRVPQDFD